MQQTFELQEFNSSFNLIYSFIEDGNVPGINQIISNFPSLVDKQNDQRQTPLHVACSCGNNAMVTYLIENGANISARDENEFTCLITASMAGSLECVQTIFASRPNLEHMDVNGWTALMWAAYKGHSEVVEYLLSQGVNLHISVAYNMTCLLWAAGRGSVNIVHFLCDKGAKVNHVDKFGNTALIWASRHGYTDIVAYLLHHKADPNIIGAHGCNCLIYAVKGNHETSLSKLLNSSKINVNQTDRNGHSALSYAAKIGSVEMTSQLLDHGAYLNLADQHGDTPLIKAIKHGHVDVVKLLLSKFADVDAKGKDEKTALHLACEMGHVQILRELLKCGCKLECRNTQSDTPLLRAVKEGNIMITKLLLSHGADVSACDLNRDTCIHLAIRSQNIQLVQLLLRNPKHGRYLYQENKFGETPYDIDANSNKKLLSQLFGSKGFSATAILSDSSFDMSSCSLAEMLTEPTFETPLCIGLYAKWGSDMTFLLHKIKYQIELFTCSTTQLEYQLPWVTLLIIFCFSFLIGLFMSFLFDNQILAGFLSFISLIAVCYSFIVLVYLGCRIGKWQWAVAMFRSMQAKDNYIKLILDICFINRSAKSGGKVKFIFSGSTSINTATVKHPTMIPDITAALVSSIEKKVGAVALRLARALFASRLKHYEEKWFLRKVCCIPSCIVIIIFLLSFVLTLLLLVVIYGPVYIDPFIQSSVTIAMYVLLSITGAIVILSAPRLYTIIKSLMHSPHKLQSSLNSRVDRNQAILQQVHRAVSTIDTIQGNQTRFCLLINALEATDEKQLADLIRSMRSIYSMQPIITIVCVDYHLLMTTLFKSYVSTNGIEVKSADYVQSTIQLPLFFSDKRQKNKFATKYDNSHSDSDMDGVEQSRRKRGLKNFDVTKWLATNECFHPINSQLIKRVASIISFTARLLRAGERNFAWNNLCSWIVLTELWPYSTSYLIGCICNKKLQHNKSLKSLFSEFYQTTTRQQSHDMYDITALQHFMSSKVFCLTVYDVMNFYAYTVNLDPKLEDSIPVFIESWGNQSTFERAHTVMSSSRSSNLSFDDVPISDWSVDDVCFRIKSIPGLDSTNFSKYDAFIRTNNIHGLALSLCDVDELKKEIHTSFGDWCLIKKFINESRFISIKTKNISFGSLACSENKKEDKGTGYPILHGDDNQQFSALSNTDRVAYNTAFKEYLRLQPPHTSMRNDTHNVLVHSQLDNESNALLNNLDINANS